MKIRYSSYKGKVRAVSALAMSLATVTATGAVAADKLCDFAVYTSNGTTLQDRAPTRCSWMRSTPPSK